MLMTIKGGKRDNLKSSYSRHCCLGPVNERRMTKLQISSSLGSFDYESFDKCESCLLGKDDGVANESKTHQILSPFFMNILRLNAQFKCQIIEYSPKFVFCRNLEKRN